MDDFLRRELPGRLVQEGCASNSKIRRLIVCGAVCVNGAQCRRPAFELRRRSAVSVEFDAEKFFFEKQPDDVLFEVSERDVLFEDDYLICVNKPAKFPTEETIVGGEKRDNLHDAVVRYLWKKNPALRNPPYVGIMHRLDRDTSGVILFTKQRAVNKPVQAMFESHDFTKIYCAVCKARPGVKITAQKKFTVELFMARVSGKSQAGKWGEVAQSRGGQYSRTDFMVLETRADGTIFVQAQLFTGRTHQIRVHLSHYGLPICGDVLYGGTSTDRLMLHAKSLSFEHPVTKERLCVESELPF